MRNLTMVLSTIVLGLMSATYAAAADPTLVLVVVGPSNHPPGSHEVAAGGRLMADALKNATNIADIRTEVVHAWPDNAELLGTVSSVVFIGDTFPAERFGNSDVAMRDLQQMMARGCGIVCVHYATGLQAEDVADDGDHPLLHWLGGYFATRCKHHQSIARIYSEAAIDKADPEHPIARGWRPFKVNDEPYINNYFGKDGNRLAVGVTPIAVSMLPPEKPQKEIVAWAIERSDKGRGFGIVMPHFYQNWRQDDLRMLILNAIVWTAGREVPGQGVKTPKPYLAKYEPESVQPKQRR